MDAQFENNSPVKARRLIGSRCLGFVVASCAFTLPLIMFLLVKPALARAAWARIARIIQRNGLTADLPHEHKAVSDADLVALRPQQQAEVLLEAAVDRAPEASDTILKHAGSWRGQLAPSRKLSGLLNTALNSDDMRVRAAAIESELAANNLAKTSRSADQLVARIEHEPPARPWSLWMLGALGNRGVESDLAFTVLLKYTHDAEEKTRYWAVEGLSLLGTDESIQPLLDVLRTDSSSEVREGAASALAQSGMLSKQQRIAAVPPLIDAAGDGALDGATHTAIYQALRNITGANVENDPAAWRNYWAESSSR